MPLPDTSCPVCNRPGPATLVETFGRFAMLRCTECALEFCDPLEYERKGYDRAYSAHEEELYVPSVAWLEQARANLPEAKWMLFSAQVEALQWLERHFPGVPLLDIGCGSGWFLARAKQRGFQVTGVEVGSAPVRLLRARGFAVECGSLEAIPGNCRPKAVTLFEVLEHLPTPGAFIAQVRERFPEACLLVSVPSGRRWTKAGSHRDLADYPPNHLTRWSPESLRQVLSRAGYADIRVSYPPPSGREVAAVSVRGLAQSWFGSMPGTLSDALGEVSLRPLRREIAVRRLKYLPGVMLAVAARMRGWSGISMLAIAQP